MKVFVVVSIISLSVRDTANKYQQHLSQFVNDIFVCLFGLRFYVPVNSYGHVEMVSSPNHIFQRQA